MHKEVMDSRHSKFDYLLFSPLICVHALRLSYCMSGEEVFNFLFDYFLWVIIFASSPDVLS